MTEENKENIENIYEEEKKKNVKKISAIIIFVVLFLFAGILILTGIISQLLGKTAENIALCIVAFILAIMLYKSKRS